MTVFKVFYGETTNYVFKKFGNHRCQRYWSVVGCFCRFLSYKWLLRLLLSRLRGLDQSQVMVGRCHALPVLGGRHIYWGTMAEYDMVCMIKVLICEGHVSVYVYVFEISIS